MADLDAFFDTRQTDWASFYNPFTSPQTRANVNDLRLQAAAGKPRQIAYDPSVGRYEVYNPAPYLPGDPNRLPPGRPGIDIPGRQPTRTALTILPFENQGNVRDPGNVDPFGSDFGFDDPALNPPVFPGQSEPRTAVATARDTTPVLPRAGQAPAARNWLTSNTRTAVTPGRTYQGTNGYSYQAQGDGTFKNLGYSDKVKASRAEQGKATGDAIRKKAGPTSGADGRDLSFSPRSVQNSVRWQTGY